MATLEKLPGIHALISKRVKVERKTHREISEELRGLYPGVNGRVYIYNMQSSEEFLHKKRYIYKIFMMRRKHGE